MKKIEEYTPRELATLSTVLGVIISAKLTINGQNVVGNFIEAVGQSILLIAAQSQNLQSQSNNQGGNNGNDNTKGSNNDLQKQIDELKEHIKEFETKLEKTLVFNLNYDEQWVYENRVKVSDDINRILNRI